MYNLLETLRICGGLLSPFMPDTAAEISKRIGSDDDIASKTFSSSCDYFYELYDGQNVGTENHSPYVAGFDYSKLAGAGVPAKSGSGQLQANNCM